MDLHKNVWNMNEMKQVFLILTLVFTNCTGWPALQHTVQSELMMNKKDNLNILSTLLLQRKETASSSITTTSPASTTTSSTKDITSFSIVSPAATGVISGTNITVTVAGNTNLTSLVANFTHTGSSVKIGNTVQISGSTSNNFKYTVNYTVYAQDGTSKAYTVNVIATSCTAASFCYVYSFGSSPPGGGANFGSFAGAAGDAISGIDSDCTANAVGAGLPASNYRALLMTTGGTTIRNQNTNWVLKPNKEYRRQNGTTVIGITNSSSVFSIFSGNLTNSFVGAFTNVYSGITVTSDTVWTPNANNCSNWTSAAAAAAQGANGNFTNVLSIDSGTSQTCNTGVAVYCIEQ